MLAKMTDQRAFQAQSVGQGTVDTVVDGPLGQAHGHHGAGGERAGPIEGGVEVVLAREHCPRVGQRRDHQRVPRRQALVVEAGAHALGARGE